MDDRRFDSLTKRLAGGMSRRGAIKAVLGLGSAAAIGGMLAEPDATKAQRRPTPTPSIPSCPRNQVPCDTGCCCPSGSEQCGSDCCPSGQSVCCNNACCDGMCTQDGSCCPAARTCFGDCCADGQRCCTNGFGCVPVSGCCGDEDCPGGSCIDAVCAPYTPTSVPTQTPTGTPPPPTATNTQPPPTSTRTPTSVPTSTRTPTQTRTPTKTAVPPTSTPTRTPGPPTFSIVNAPELGNCQVWAVLENYPVLPYRYNVEMRGGMWVPCSRSTGIQVDAAGNGRGSLLVDCRDGDTFTFTLSPGNDQIVCFDGRDCNDLHCRRLGGSTR